MTTFKCQIHLTLASLLCYVALTATSIGDLEAAEKKSKLSMGLSYSAMFFPSTEEEMAHLISISFVRRLTDRADLLGNIGFSKTLLDCCQPLEYHFAYVFGQTLESLKLIRMRTGLARRWQSSIRQWLQFYLEGGATVFHMKSSIDFFSTLHQPPESILQKGWLMGPWAGFGFHISAGQSFYASLGVDYQGILFSPSRNNAHSLRQVNFKFDVYRRF